MNTGGSFTAVTVSSKTSESSREPSLTVTMMESVPNQLSINCIVNWSKLLSTISEAIPSSYDMALKVNSLPSTSLAESIIIIVPSSAITFGPISVNSGASFTGFTITTKLPDV